MKKITFLILILLIFTFNSVESQTSTSPEKQKAVKELIGLITQNNQFEDLAKAMTDQLAAMNEEIVKASIAERTDLTPAERKSIEKALAGDMQKYQKKLEEKLMKKLDYNVMLDEISNIVYDKFYSFEEINDLIVFYKTPTGQKTLKVMQPLMAETMQLTQERITPKIISVMQELRDEQKRNVSKRVEELKPRTEKR